ncbi:uncharacterized protein DC041_0008131 [Schistosoma bovis]|uniref:Uncharacterized protein n=1 Tax=Schistosoma bovis TaxID=6184 RepID=A0A430QCG4_SCHBO|nr:uncharacterized protein DC041_0008131 [Schistosoma bovis]
MKKVDKNESKPKVSEYLPRCGVTVDLYYPEQMSIDQLLEIFERRGFKSLVSNVNTLEHIVNLYYDHLMPKCHRNEWIDEFIESTTIHPSIDDDDVDDDDDGDGDDDDDDNKSNLSKEKMNLNDKITKPKRNIDHHLDHLIITYDKKRFTPPCSIQTLSSKEHHQFICKTSNSLHQDNDHHSKLSSSHSTINENSSNNSKFNDHSLKSMKKRPKINRNFETLTNNL